MSDEEQLYLRWNSFNSNLSTGFHESLCRGDLVDVTLAAEGQLVKAHRLVLSVCSPYFQKMFTQIPTNQHAFIFLNDVSHSALVDLIQFMYCGEVKVKEDALPTLVSIAEALQIKGLAEEPTRLLSESSDDNPAAIIAQKRPISRSVTPVFAPALKKNKNNDPLKPSEPIYQHQIVTTDETNSSREETKFIKMPMESMPTKLEPYYGDDDTDEVETTDQDTVYFIDDSDDDDSRDSSYFPENEMPEFTEPIVKTEYQSTNETQYGNIQSSDNGIVRYATTKRGRKMLCINGYYYVQNSESVNNIFWRCPRYEKIGCRATAITSKSPNDLSVRLTGAAHSHDFEETVDMTNDSFDTSQPTYQLTNNGQVEKSVACEFEEQYAETVKGLQSESEDDNTRFTTTKRGNPKLHYYGYIFMAHHFNKTTTQWRCSKYKQLGCKAMLTSSRSQNVSSIVPRGFPHSHGIEKDKLQN